MLSAPSSASSRAAFAGTSERFMREKLRVAPWSGDVPRASRMTARLSTPSELCQESSRAGIVVVVGDVA